ncbi:MAG: hypothetical protein MUF86_14005 [Akkermansiaceae bacterium]|nr:hypothetical protein [Akkermansiaceae bacterium]
MMIAYPARCGLALAAGACYSLAFPPLGHGWLVVPGLAGLLLALNGLHGTRARAVGFLHGMAAYGIGLSWLYEIFGILVVVLCCVLAAFTALFAEMQSRAAGAGISGWEFALFTAVNWGGWEFIRAELFPLRFPWMTPGLAIGPNALLPWIGVYGVGVLIVFAVALLAHGAWKRSAVLFVLLVWMIKLPSAHQVPDASEEGTVSIAGLQFENVTIDEFLKATSALPGEVRYVVWPEYAVPYDIRKNPRDWKLVTALCLDRGITLTFGTQRLHRDGNAWRNIALTLDAGGVLGEHAKVHTVHFFDDGTPGDTALPVGTPHGKVGTPICFDGDYEGIVRRMTAAGAELFVVPVMDAAPWTARQHDQHAELFRIRAAENGRWMFVCASSGVSQIIDPAGQVHARLGALEQGVLAGRIRRENQMTFYTRYGWLTPWGVLVVAGVCWIGLLLKRRKPALAGGGLICGFVEAAMRPHR